MYFDSDYGGLKLDTHLDILLYPRYFSPSKYLQLCVQLWSHRWCLLSATGNSLSAEAPVPPSVKPEQLDTKPSRVTKMFLNCFSCFGLILNLPPPPPHQKHLNVESLGAKSLWGVVVRAGIYWHSDAELNCAEPGIARDYLLLRVSRQQQEQGFAAHCKLPFCLLRRHFCHLIKEPKIQFSQ